MRTFKLQYNRSKTEQAYWWDYRNGKDEPIQFLSHGDAVAVCCDVSQLSGYPNDHKACWRIVDSNGKVFPVVNPDGSEFIPPEE